LKEIEIEKNKLKQEDKLDLKKRNERLAVKPIQLHQYFHFFLDVQKRKNFG